MSLHQPIAVIGIGICLPFASSFAELKHWLKCPNTTQQPLIKWKYQCGTARGYQFADLALDYKKFGIPPIFRKAVSTETILALKAVEDALSGLDVSQWDLDRTDCFCGTSFGNDAIYRNAAKVAAIKAKAVSLGSSRELEVDQFKAIINEHFTTTSHDRIGEMASSISARIAHYVGARGKCMAIDSLELTGIQLLRTASDSLLHSDSSVAILTTVQRFNSPLIVSLLQNVIGGDLPILCEGAISLVVQSLDKAVAHGNTIYAVLSEFETGPAEANFSVAMNSYSQFGYGLSNQVFQGIVEFVTGIQQKDSLEGKTLLGEYWRLQLGMMGAEQDVQDIVPEPIAIVGYQSIVARCCDKEAVWKTIVDGQDNIAILDDKQLSHSAFVRFGSSEKLSTYTAYGAAMPDNFALDYRLPYPVMPAKKARMDPVQRHALICASEALSETTVQGRCAVVVGSNLSLKTERDLSLRDFWQPILQLDPVLQPPDIPTINHFSLDGCSASGIARTISNSFKLSAECVAVEAACASSLAALHYAVRALQSRRIDTALCGGVEFAANERDMVLCCAQMMLSKHKIAPFSASADGFCPGDGGAFFVLKRLSDAQALGERILGVVHSISGSCDAKSMTAPDVEGQVLAIRKTLALSDVSPDKIELIEAHGTGTQLGDKTEIDAIAACYTQKEREIPLVIGSAKYNFGHCFAGAGAIGLSKILLSFRHKILPPTPARGEYNSALPIFEIPARILSYAEPWQSSSVNQSRFAAQNSFGTGGINYHIILEQGA